MNASCWQVWFLPAAYTRHVFTRTCAHEKSWNSICSTFPGGGIENRNILNQYFTCFTRMEVCIHHRIQLAVGDMTMIGWKPTISLIHPPRMEVYSFIYVIYNTHCHTTRMPPQNVAFTVNTCNAVGGDTCSSQATTVVLILLKWDR